MHEQFKALIIPYQIKLDSGIQEIMERQMIETYHKINAESEAARKELSKQVVELSKKIERLEERYVLEEISQEIFGKYNQKFLSEKKELEAQLAKAGNFLSNLDNCIQTCFEYASKLASLWDSSDYGTKQQLQYLLFPDGITYERKKDTYRTGRVNAVLATSQAWRRF